TPAKSTTSPPATGKQQQSKTGTVSKAGVHAQTSGALRDLSNIPPTTTSGALRDLSNNQNPPPPQPTTLAATDQSTSSSASSKPSKRPMSRQELNLYQANMVCTCIMSVFAFFLLQTDY